MIDAPRGRKGQIFIARERALRDKRALIHPKAMHAFQKTLTSNCEIFLLASFPDGFFEKLGLAPKASGSSELPPPMLTLPLLGVLINILFLHYSQY